MKEIKRTYSKMSCRWIFVVTFNLFLGHLITSTLATPMPTPTAFSISEDTSIEHSTPVLASASSTSASSSSPVQAAEVIAVNDDLRFTPATINREQTLTTARIRIQARESEPLDLESATSNLKASIATENTAATPLPENGYSTATTTLASSNAPATTTNKESEQSPGKAAMATIAQQQQREKAKEFESAMEAGKNGQKYERIKQQIVATAEKPMEQEQQQQREEEQHQTLTTEVSMLQETDMQQQGNGNAETATTLQEKEIAATTDTTGAMATATATTSNSFTNKPQQQQHQHHQHSEQQQEPTIMLDDFNKKPETEIVIDAIPFSLNTKAIVTSELPPPASERSLKSKEIEHQKSLEDFKPLIQEANHKLIMERTIFTPKKGNTEEQEWKQNLMPNEVEHYGLEKPKKLYGPPFEHNINWSPYLHPATPAVDFTGKVLQEEDGVITEIEEKFRLKEFATDVAEKRGDETTTEQPVSEKLSLTTSTSVPTSPRTTEKSLEKPLVLMVNHEKSSPHNPNTHRSKALPAAVGVAMRPVEFIERRVKKSFDFPMHRLASDAGHALQHFDFANTKFSSNLNEPRQHLSIANGALGGGKSLPAPLERENNSGLTLNQGHDMNVMHVPRQQPEFSTTKFYNSKELYNEMLLHKNKHMLVGPQQQKDTSNSLNEEVAPSSSLTLNSFAVLHSPKIAKLEEMHELRDAATQTQKSLAIKRVTVQATKSHQDTETTERSSSSSTAASTSSTTTSTTTKAPTTSSSSTTQSSTEALTKTTTTTIATKKYHKELKKAKLLIKTMLPSNSQNLQAKTSEESGTNLETIKSLDSADAASAATKSATVTPEVEQSRTSPYIANPSSLTTTKPSNEKQKESNSNTLTSGERYQSGSFSYTTSKNSAKSNVNAALSSASSSSATPRPLVVSTNPTKSSLKPIVRPRILSRLQEKINSLECEIQNVPQDSHLWRGNETHELLLPIMTPENCKTDKDCTAMMVSWEGEAEIQSGDILIVEINDALLNPKDVNLTTSAHNTQVYQVTRSGHEHCDVTEGILLDITPLIVDGRKLVTLYDKDLTEGVNLLIVVSELWGSQCVRLKVTTKTENCGENADCSGKGVCFSNADMEEYECQCCSGFAGPHCEEIDACTPSPCTNNGICVDLSQGHEGNSYQCLCPYGYTGKNCQYELDPCNPAECMNGGSCVGNSTHFRCECSPGFTGPLCQHILNECESSPCIHGICVDQEDGFRCFCQPGFAGELCNFEYNECESNPCQNGGECIDHIGSYECHCSKGYTGTRCHIKVDFCANKPCPEGRRCIDHGNDYSCECLGGRNGPDCNEMLRTQCNVNPCTHGGTCWSSGDSFYCACRPGYTGTMCEDEFVVETVVSSSEFMVDDTSARNFNDKSFGSSVVLKSPIELHNAYTAAIVLALVIFFVALYLTICHCKVNQTYRKFSTRTYGFLPILGFRWRTKQPSSKISRHWLSGKGLGAVVGPGAGANAMRATGVATNSSLSVPSQRNSVGHLPTANASSSGHQRQQQQQHHQHQHHVGQLNERPFQRHLAMNLENDMYYTVDFSENSQHSPLIQ